MAAASDKARFYLEQTVPELQEYEKKDIFSKEEITSITKQRSYFEHLLNSRDASPSLYARYASYEMNLDLLRRKRIKRLGVKSPLHSGQRRIYGILDRATKKFHGDLSLWMQYIEYARHCKANKRVEELLTRCLRMHPTKPELWVYGAKYALDTDGDMRAARGYMQRGLRFCDRSRMLWLEYGKLEMLYVAKLAGRRRILRLEGTNSTIEDKPIEDNEIDADTIALSALTAEDINPALAGGEDASEAALKNLASAPVLTGAIPMAVFNAAMQRFGDDLQLALQFFNTFADFKQVPSLETVLQHTIDVMSEISPMSMEFMSCVFRRPFILMASDSPEFPAALGQSIQYIDLAIEDRPGITKELVGLAITWLAPLYRKQELDESLKRVIGASLRQFTKALDQGQFVEIVKGLKSEKRVDDAKHLLKFGIKHFGSTEQLLQI